MTTFNPAPWWGAHIASATLDRPRKRLWWPLVRFLAGALVGTALVPLAILVLL